MVSAGVVTQSDALGAEQWWISLGAVSARAVAETGHGFALAGTIGPGPNSIWTASFDNQGNEQWTRVLGNRQFPDKGYDVAALSDGSVVVVGAVTSLAATTGFIARYSPNGDEVWSGALDMGEQDYAHVAVGTDPITDAIYALGWPPSDSGFAQFRLHKYAP